MDMWRSLQPRECRPEWFFDQCLGLTSGLQKIHRLGLQSSKETSNKPIPTNNVATAALSSSLNETWGHHGDLKPENILWFKENPACRENHLAISDFFLSRFGTIKSPSNVLQTNTRGISGTYRTPELQLDGRTTQFYDIWSLGCVLLEFTSWFLLGYDKGIKDFSRARCEDVLEPQKMPEDKFFRLLEGGKAVVRASVISVSRLRNRCVCSA